MPASAKDIDVRRHLAGLVFENERLDSFIDWFVHAQWAIEHQAPEGDVDLSYRIENRIAEYTGGFVTAVELVGLLRADAVEFDVQARSTDLAIGSALVSSHRGQA